MLTRRGFLATSLAAPMLMRPAFADEGPIKLRHLYDRKALSDLAKSSEGKRISVDGYMAPPLKAESKFFVLTRRPMSVCPFCETEAEWPNDILAVYTKRIVDVVPYNVKIVASGLLELGAYKDPETGFVSMVRLSDASYG
ncbi:hypothetical protein [Pseudodonghicola xiamenensis]|uniref:Uncharacterized protein n=1 Tax=Pseudodonghicola xiamenensis TaxID=337702 RepID=A0A8J3HBC6_9RHOB|nr:hypothetical protein [Pseudodonghicola xiamenensis]GHG98627.1 hypothetical protein GCM10010961_34100 [Pseudodonghicola xiamenensis]